MSTLKKKNRFLKTELCKEWQKNMELVQLQIGDWKRSKTKRSVQPQLEMMA